MLGQEAEKLEQQMQILEQQSQELSGVKDSLLEIAKDKKKEILANLGKGIFAKATLMDDDLFVNVGKEVLVKKTREETIKVIDEQIVKLSMGQQEITQKIGELQEEMQKLLMGMQQDATSKDHTEKHCSHEDCECEEPCADCECEHDKKKGKK